MSWRHTHGGWGGTRWAAGPALMEPQAALTTPFSAVRMDIPSRLFPLHLLCYLTLVTDV